MVSSGVLLLFVRDCSVVVNGRLSPTGPHGLPATSISLPNFIAAHESLNDSKSQRSQWEYS
jgi:hypothetical protein